MKRFKVDGLWSTTREGKNMMPGILRNGRSGLSLRLFGSFKDGWTPNELGRYEKLYGQIARGLDGNHATLFDCVTESTSVSTSSVRSEKIRCARAVIGDDLAPEQPLRFDSLEYDFTYLDNWVGRSHVAADFLGGGKEASIRYRQPEPIEFSVDNFKIQIGFTANLVRSTSGATIREKSQIAIEPIGEGFAEEASIRPHLSPLQNLLTFATDAPNEVDRALLQGGRISYGDFEVPKRFSLYYTPAFRPAGTKENLHTRDMLFNLDDVLNSGLNIFQNWYNFARSHGSFVEVYFAHIYSAPKLLSYRFRDIMAAFRLLGTHSPGVSERTKCFLTAVESAAAHFDEPVRAWLGQALPIGDKVEMPFRLMDSLERNGEVMSRLIGDFHEFVTVVCRTLEHVENRTPEPNGPILQGGDLHYAIEKIRWLIKLMVLRELGFNDETVMRLAARNTSFMFLTSR